MSDNESKSRETVADIVAEMRQGMSPTGTAECQYLESDICTLADRLEAAAKRLEAPGNAAAMREALVSVRALIADEPDGTPMIDAMKATVEAALAAPPRNCDVGTTDEQVRRFKNEICFRLPNCRPWEHCLRCFAIWAQTPYKAKEGAGE
jgi:hypothetical protein